MGNGNDDRNTGSEAAEPCTVGAWLSCIVNPLVRDKALQYAAVSLGAEADSISDALHGGFNWHCTDEGGDLWRGLYNDYCHGREIRFDGLVEKMRSLFEERVRGRDLVWGMMSPVRFNRWCEGSSLSALTAFRDIDGVIWYAYGHGMPVNRNGAVKRWTLGSRSVSRSVDLGGDSIFDIGDRFSAQIRNMDGWENERGNGPLSRAYNAARNFEAAVRDLKSAIGYWDRG